MSLSQYLIIFWPLTANKNNLIINNLFITLLIQHRNALKERLKEVEGTRKHKPRMFTKNITTSIPSIGGTACPVTIVKRPRYPDLAKVA